MLLCGRGSPEELCWDPPVVDANMILYAAEPTPTPEPTATPAATEQPSHSLPQTGDTAMPAVCTVLVLTTLGTALLLRKRRGDRF